MERSGGGGGGKALRLESADGEIFDVPEEVAMCSRTVKHMLTDLEDVGPESMPHCEDEEDETAPIFLPNVPSSILSLVIEYCGWLVTSEFYQTNKRKTKKKTEHESKQKEKGEEEQEAEEEEDEDDFHRRYKFCTCDDDSPGAELMVAKQQQQQLDAYRQQEMEKRELTEWEEAWCQRHGLNRSRSKLFAVILAANYLHIPPLLELCCRKAADSLRGKSGEQVRKYLGVEEALTPEEYQSALSENEQLLKGLQEKDRKQALKEIRLTK